jgi:hypothetical protein
MRIICAALAFLFAWAVFTAMHSPIRPVPTVTITEGHTP